MEESTAPATSSLKWPEYSTLSELKTQSPIAFPLIAMNLTWFAKLAITTAFLGRLGKLPLAGGTLGFTFANVTGISVLSGLCGAMEPICGQAFGAKNFKLLHKTLIMATLLLLSVSIPIAFLWLNVEKILLCFGQQSDISITAKKYLIYLLPDLFITSFLLPLKAYLCTQNITLPIMVSSALAMTLHVPINVWLSRAKGLEGVSMAVWITDLIVVILLIAYVFISEQRKGGKWKEAGWFEQGITEWTRLLKLSGPYCLTTCLEWWCIEILVLLAGRLPNAAQSVGVLAIVLNYDYLLYSVMLSLATCASIRVSNELGANNPRIACRSAYVSIVTSVFFGFLGGSTMVAMRGIWGPLFSHDQGIIRNVKRMMLLMAIVDLVCFPTAVCGGILRGTARPWLGVHANTIGFYLFALPLGLVLAFRIHLGLGGLLMGFLVGIVACLVLVLVFISRLDWDKEADKAKVLATFEQEVDRDSEDHAMNHKT